MNDTAAIRRGRWERLADVLAGPVLGKDLATTARSGRVYLLRFLYVAGLTVLAYLAWGSLESASSGQAGISRQQFSEAGLRFVASVLRVQFYVMVFLAAAVMSTAIRSELQHRTLGILMTTPASSRQIVAGKFFSRLLLLGGLLACSLPVLAVARVYGGVEWSFPFRALAMTAATMLAIGSLSLLTSLYARSSFSAILWAGLLYFLLHLVVFALLKAAEEFVLSDSALQSGWADRAMTALSPVLMGAHIADAALNPGNFQGIHPYGTVLTSWWWVGCLTSLVFASGVLGLVACNLRPITLRYIEQGFRLKKRRPSQPTQDRAKTSLAGARAALRHVGGSPLLWKEMRFYFPRKRVMGWLSGVVAMGVLATSYAANIASGMDLYLLQMPYMMLYFLTGLIVTAAIAGMCVAEERQSRSLPLLLSLPVRDGYLLGVKAAGVVCRAMPGWGLLALHVAVFTVAGYLHPVAVLLTSMLVAWVVAFLVGVGLYCSARSQQASTGIAVTLVIAATLWIILPVAAETLWRGESAWWGLALNPGAQLVAIGRGCADAAELGDGLGSMRLWLAGRRVGLAEMLRVLGLSLVGYGAVGGVCFWRAGRRLRQVAFEGATG